MINIVKYGNRKLYAKDFSRYITLSEMIKLVKANNQIKVTDHVSKLDVTNKTLKSALLECEFSEQELINLLKK